MSEIEEREVKNCIFAVELIWNGPLAQISHENTQPLSPPPPLTI